MSRNIRILLPCLCLVAVLFNHASGQTTTLSPSTTPGPFTSTTPNSEESGGTTLVAADSAVSTTTVATESEDLEATTEGQESNNRFESTRTKPLANQEATTPTPNVSSGGKTKDKIQDTKTPWKFGRGGSSQNGWSIGTTANKGFPQWKKETSLPVGSGPEIEQASGKNTNDQQAYIVWSVGQGTPPNGWSLNGGQEGWATGGAVQTNTGWNQGDAPANSNTGVAGWNTGEWTDDQPADVEDSQDAWTDDEGAPQDNAEGGWANDSPEGWNSPNGNAGAWTNGSPLTSQGNVPPPGWAPQGGGQKGGWDDGSTGQVINNGGGGWVAPQPVSQNGGNGWAPLPEQPVGPPTSAVQGQWNPSNGGEWTNPQPQNIGPDTYAPGGDWSNGQQNGGWNPGSQGVIQEPDLSWKVYNEDTHTMDNLGDDSGWKVVGDGGADGWKLVNENGNIEWKIENVNGEWKVISAEDFSNQDNSTTPSSGNLNATTASTNTTTDAPVTTTPTPSWDDTKQGRYIVWKFSENGKGEARVYSGDGAEPVVWTVGDNQYWQETIGLSQGNNNAKGTWNINTGNNPNSSTSVGNGWNLNNSGFQNSAQKPNSDSWQNTGAVIGNVGWQAEGGGGGSPQAQNDAWQNGGPSAPTSGNWQPGGTAALKNSDWKTVGQNKPTGNQWQPGNPSAPINTNWQTGGQVAPTSTTWQSGSPAAPTSTKWKPGGTAPAASPTVGGQGWNNGNGAQKNGGVKKIAPQTNSWSNAALSPLQNGGWQNPPPAVTNGWNQANNPPPPSGAWQSSGPTNQTPSPQIVWQSRGTAPAQSNGGWAPRENNRQNQAKGRGKTQAKRGRNSNGWQPNKSNNNANNNVRGPWNNKNGITSWNQGNTVTTQASWDDSAPSIAPPASNSNGGVITNWPNTGNTVSTAGGWSGNPQTATGQNGQTVPYIIVIKQPDGTPAGGATNPWSNTGNIVNTKKPKNRNSNKPKNNRRGSGYKMNQAGSSGWQWNPQGGSGGWKWKDGWMGSGGGFGGWMGDKGTMYSGWRPTKTNATPTNTQPNRQAGGGPRSNKKGKMVFVFGSKKNSGASGQKPNTNGEKRGRQVIILDYTNGKTLPNSEEGMKKDIESVIQALRSSKSSGPQSTAAWKRGVQPQNQQQWGR